MFASQLLEVEKPDAVDRCGWRRVDRRDFWRCDVTTAARKRADLVLSGGGVKGVGLVGAVAALMDAGYRIQIVSGTSAGSIVGAVVAAGFKA
jgi:hypothetical protein